MQYGTELSDTVRYVVPEVSRSTQAVLFNRLSLCYYIYIYIYKTHTHTHTHTHRVNNAVGGLTFVTRSECDSLTFSDLCYQMKLPACKMISILSAFTFKCVPNSSLFESISKKSNFCQPSSCRGGLFHDLRAENLVCSLGIHGTI